GDRVLRVYRNGLQGGTTATLTGTLQEWASYDMMIGGNDNTDRAFNGLIDEVRVYNRALSASEVLDVYNSAGGVVTTSTPTPTTSETGLLQQSNLVYEGAFRVPGNVPGSPDSSRMLHAGGSALAYNPARNSLFIVGHPNYQLTAEIGIPQIINSNSISSLATASILQNLYDSTDGKKDTPDLTDSNGNRIGGHLLYNNKFYTTVFIFYDNAPYQILSHLVSSTDLSITNDIQGPFQVGTVGAGHVSGYMANIPTEWQSAFGGTALTGNCCLSITARTSVGPSASIFNPADLGVKNPVPATPVVDYSLDHPIANSQVGNSLYVLSDWVQGMVFPKNTASLLFFGSHGTGSVCYGESSATECYDPASPYKGYHAYPYKYQVWAYNANDLVKVKNGQLQPWQVQPYSVWNFNLPFEADDTHIINGAAYDPATQRIFLSQHYKDGTLPIIHVFKILI
ncbi:hypothetical protein HYW20_07785, partial [Candidatus Woesearchaeota archaeon]|nr:hypothetical protein [Candidatus Woesearchaeota archaeon]